MIRIEKLKELLSEYEELKKQEEAIGKIAKKLASENVSTRIRIEVLEPDKEEDLIHTFGSLAESEFNRGYLGLGFFQYAIDKKEGLQFVANDSFSLQILDKIYIYIKQRLANIEKRLITLV